MDILVKHFENFINSTLKTQARNFLSELRLTEALLRSDINELNSKIERLLQRNSKQSYKSDKF